MILEMAIWCVAIPFLAIAVGAVISLTLQFVIDKRYADALTATTIAVAWWIGVAISHFGRQSWELWPEDAWRRILLPLGVGSVTLAGLHAAKTSWRNLRWPIACLSVVACVYIATPTGEGWEDTVSLHHLWIPMAIASGFINLWSLSELVERDGGRWAALVALTGIATSLLYALGIYAGLAELIAASLVATLTASFLAAATNRLIGASAVIYPASILACTATMSARYYSYEQPNLYAITGILFLPSIICAVDRCVPQQWRWRRVIIAALFAAISLGILAWFLNPEADAEQW